MKIYTVVNDEKNYREDFYSLSDVENTEDLNSVFEKKAPKIFNSKKMVYKGKLELLPAFPKLDLWGDITLEYKNGQMTMEGSLGSSNHFLRSSDVHLQKKISNPKTEQEMISTLKQWRSYQQSAFKELVDKMK